MRTIAVSQKEYQSLVEARLRYEYIRRAMEEDIFTPPPTRKRGEVIKAFRATKKYNKQFLRSLAAGLKRSSYFTA